MRLIHPRILEESVKPQYPKTILAHAWAEVFKFVKSGQKHPKMFIDNDIDLGCYLGIVYVFSVEKGCKFDKDKVASLGEAINDWFLWTLDRSNINTREWLNSYFDDNYLFSDLGSQYIGGVNMFPAFFGDDWRKYCPIISHDEIARKLGNSGELKKYEVKTKRNNYVE